MENFQTKIKPTIDPSTLMKLQLQAGVDAARLSSRIRKLLAARVTALQEILDSPVSSEQDKSTVAKQLLSILEILDLTVDKSVQRSMMRGAPAATEDPTAPTPQDVV